MIDRELLEKAHQGDKAARDAMVEKNTGLVWSVAHRYKNRGLELDDIFQIGIIGLIKAVDKFDVQYGVEFSTYAVPMIAGEIRRYIRDDGIIKVSRSIKENAWKIKKAMQDIQDRNGKSARIEEIIKETGLDREAVIEAIDSGLQVESLNRPIEQSEGRDVCLEDQLAGEDSREQILNSIMIHSILAKLEGAERQLILLRYFRGRTQSETAKILGMSQVQVSRAEKKILGKMKNML